MLKTSLRLLLLSLIMLLTIIYGISFYQQIIVAVEYPKIYYGFLTGIAAFVIISKVKFGIIQHNLAWLRVFSHELTHTFFSLLCF